MMKNNNIKLNGFNSSYEDGELVVFGTPMDNTTSFKPGTRFASNAVRIDSIGFETYSPYLNKDLSEYNLHDGGDVYIPIGNTGKSLESIYDYTKKILNDNKIPVMIGGEHLTTYGTFKAVFEKYPDVKIIHLDAHTDLRDEFFGEKFSHATVLRRCHDLIGDNRIFQFGIRSGEKAEFSWSKNHTYMEKFDIKTLKKIVEKIKGEKVYITIDLDVLDPSVFRGTGTPEPGGISFKDLMDGVHLMKELEIVGGDIVELSPHYDNSGISNAVAFKILRELVLTIL